MLLFFIVSLYSLWVNALGAITTNRNPPQAEVLALEKASGKQERYSFDRNLEFLKENKSKSVVYNSWAKSYVNAGQYLIGIWTAIGLVTLLYTLKLVGRD